MYKKIKGIMALALALTFIPFSTTALFAEETVEEENAIVEVANATQLLAAVEKDNAKIVLTDDITVEDKVNIVANNVEIDGAGHAITANRNKDEWSGFYVLHFYRVNGTVKNIKLTNGDAGLLVNGSNVTLEGEIDLSGNGFGGIEVSMGTDVAEFASLDVTGANLINDTETDNHPTIWVEKDQGTVVSNSDQLIETVVGDQTFYHLTEVFVTPTYEVTSEADLLAAINAGESHITLMNNITVTQKMNFMSDVEIDGNGHTITGNATDTWSGLYLFHFYQVNATVKNITLTGGDAGILVNGSNVVLEGTVNVSDNVHGGIEVSQGTDVAEIGKLDITNATVVNTSEEYGRPTIWIDNKGGVVNYIDGQARKVYPVEKNQEFFFINGMTAQEEIASGLLFNSFALEAKNGITVVADKATMTVDLTKTGVDFTEEELVDYFVRVIMSEDNAKRYALVSNGQPALKEKDITTEEQVREDVLTFFRDATNEAASTRATTDRETNMEELLTTTISLRMFYEVDGSIVPTDQATVNFEFVKTEAPVKPKPEDKTDGKDGKTPDTGINASYAAFLMTGVAGFALLAVLKKRRYN